MKNIFFGMIIGVANLVPGVSGGTLALILGIYARLIKSVGYFDSHFFSTLFKHIKERNVVKLKELVITKETRFLATVVAGAGISVVAFSYLMKYLLSNHMEPTYAFFFGLILLSIVVPVKMVSKIKPIYLFWIILGAFLTINVAANVDPAEKVINKSDSYQMRVTENQTEEADISFGAGDAVKVFLSASLAISAMVLPGVSGSLVLLLTGMYYEVIDVLSRLNNLFVEDMIFLLVFGLGMVIGIMFFVKIFNLVYSKFKDQTLLFLTGLMVGSLYALWPFKDYINRDVYIKDAGEIVLKHGEKIYTNVLILPSDASIIIPSVIAFAVSIVIMGGFLKYENNINR